MTYDFHWSGGSAGPIAPKWWVNDVASYASRVIAPGKISMGMPAYGRDWFVKAVSGHCPSSARTTISRSTRQMWAFAESVGKTPKWQERGTSRKFSYVRKYSSGGLTCRAKRVVWFDDGKSLEMKAQLVDKYAPPRDRHLGTGQRRPRVLATAEAVRPVAAGQLDPRHQAVRWQLEPAKCVEVGRDVRVVAVDERWRALCEQILSFG